MSTKVKTTESSKMPPEVWLLVLEPLRGEIEFYSGSHMSAFDTSITIDTKVAIYWGEETGGEEGMRGERYATLLALSSTCTKLRPIAQEELFHRIDLRSIKSLILLMRSLKASNGLRTYASQTKHVYLGWERDDETMEKQLVNEVAKIVGS
jgi:hypothetical protein